MYGGSDIVFFFASISCLQISRALAPAQELSLLACPSALAGELVTYCISAIQDTQGAGGGARPGPKCLFGFWHVPGHITISVLVSSRRFTGLLGRVRAVRRGDEAAPT